MDDNGAEAQSAAVWVALPPIWPPLIDTFIGRSKSKSGDVLELWFTATGFVGGRWRASSGSEIVSYSAYILGEGIGQGMLMIAAIFDGRDLQLLLNGDKGPGGDAVVVERRATVVVGPTSIDEVGINSALNRRRQRLSDYLRQGFDAVAERQRWSDLRREARLLGHASGLLRQGDSDFVVQVATHLRKLIGNGSGNHLLQDCAAILDMPLLVWEHRDGKPQFDETIPPPTHLVFEVLTIRPQGPNNQQTDLDTWLSRSGWTVASKGLTNAELLHSIADKIGAHLDWKSRDVVDALSSIEDGEMATLERYLLDVTDVVLLLAEDVLRLSPK